MADDAQRIAALEAELAALRAEMQDFTYTVSHDLRASLRHILSYAQLVQEDAAPLLPPETLGFVNTITDSARHMGVLMDGLMELSRLGTAAVSITRVPLVALLHERVADLQLRDPGSVVAWQLPALLPGSPEAMADAPLLRAALSQVLDNAVKFTAHKDVRQVAVTAQVNPAGNWVTLQVADNGAGFNPALQSKLFKPFSRLHTVKQFAGIGMGLALTRKMLERMDAQVTAVGAVEAGCTVSITLPCAPPL
jgi:signal transduction histidine kinase